VKADGTEALRQKVARVDDFVGAPTFNLRDFLSTEDVEAEEHKACGR